MKFRPEKREKNKIEELIKNFPWDSSCGVDIETDGNPALFPSIPVPKDKKVQERYIREAEIKWGISKEDFPNISKEKYDERVLRDILASFRGGVGITYRDLEEVEELMPGMRWEIQNINGKIVFLGNGFSLLPLLAAKEYAAGKVSEPPVIVDLFDYGLVQKQLLLLQAECKRQKVSFPFSEELKNVSELLEASNAGLLKMVRTVIGFDETPPSIQSADLVINCFGPNLNERYKIQLNLLKKQGKLFFSGFESGYAIQEITENPNFTIQERGSISGPSWLIQRIK